jgi:hypothetical protein
MISMHLALYARHIVKLVVNMYSSESKLMLKVDGSIGSSDLYSFWLGK